MGPCPALYRFQNSAKAQNGQMKPRQGAVMYRIVGFQDSPSEFDCSLLHAMIEEVTGRDDHTKQ